MGKAGGTLPISGVSVNILSTRASISSRARTSVSNASCGISKPVEAWKRLATLNNDVNAEDPPHRDIDLMMLVNGEIESSWKSNPTVLVRTRTEYQEDGIDPGYLLQ